MITVPAVAPEPSFAAEAGLRVKRLNSQCFCFPINEGALHRALASGLGDPALVTLIEQRCPYLFASQPVFVSDAQWQGMEAVIRAVESVIAMPAYREHVLRRAAPVAQHDTGAQSVFFGYDFHLEGDGVSLIEINTNSGGAMLNAALARAQRRCCPSAVHLVSPAASGTSLEQSIFDMFLSEWTLAGRTYPLRTIAIVDRQPQQQYLYPEFVLFQRLFEAQGLQAIIADPGELRFSDGRLWHGTTGIDLVYNRLTDFMLEMPESAALRTAYLEDAAVVTPHPRAHALYADKANLALLSSDEALQTLGVSAPTRRILTEGIPRTVCVNESNAERLWSERRQFFFKPHAGFGSRAAYRGAKLTSRVWQEILAGDYIAQAMALPPERTVRLDDEEQVLKFDVRVYVYQGRTQWVAARLYQGQTTNFRTPGGGFAPVYRLNA